MKKKNNEIVYSDNNTFLDSYFEDMNLNEELSKIYEKLGDETLKEKQSSAEELTNLRNANHKMYHNIDIASIDYLTDDFGDLLKETISLYNNIDSGALLTSNYEDTLKYRKYIVKIISNIKKIDIIVNKKLSALESNNECEQSKINIAYLKGLDIDANLKDLLINKYNDLVLYSSVIPKTNYEALNREITRKKYIDNIFKLLGEKPEHKEQKIDAPISILTKLKKEVKELKELGDKDFLEKSKLSELNEKIEKENLKYTEKFHYLEDLVLEKSKYTEDYKNFKNFYNSILEYNKENYDEVKQAYEVLAFDDRVKTIISDFETSFLQERENNKEEEHFVYERYDIKNIKNSLDYISSNYIDTLLPDEKKLLENMYEEIETNHYNLDEIEENLSVIVKKIWKNSITNIYAYKENEDFCFLCSNNKFKGEKNEAVLLTRKMLNRMEDYSNYQIGFICSYNDNILYITENCDKTNIDHNDLTSLKTPLQLEQEFINFNVCNKIDLDGFLTKMEAVYYIDNNLNSNYFKALELANIHKIPLIIIKKDNC